MAGGGDIIIAEKFCEEHNFVSALPYICRPSVVTATLASHHRPSLALLESLRLSHHSVRSEAQESLFFLSWMLR